MICRCPSDGDRRQEMIDEKARVLRDLGTPFGTCQCGLPRTIDGNCVSIDYAPLRLPTPKGKP